MDKQLPLQPLQPLRPLRILVVEDQIHLGQVICALLEAADFQVDLCDDGGSAVEKLRATTYDLMISDLHMPVMDGLQLLEWVRGEAKMTLPVIILSANTNANFTQRVQALGVLGVLKKPIDMDNLVAKIKALMGGNV